MTNKFSSDHPASFAYKWQHASEHERLNYETMAAVAEPKTDSEKGFILWLAGTDEESRANFLSIVERLKVQ